MEGKTAMLFHAVARIGNNQSFTGEIAGYRWVSRQEIEAMEITQFTEFFNKDLLLEYLDNDSKLIGFDFIKTQPYYKLSNDTKYQKWKASDKKFK